MQARQVVSSRLRRSFLRLRRSKSLRRLGASLVVTMQWTLNPSSWGRNTGPCIFWKKETLVPTCFGNQRRLRAYLLDYWARSIENGYLVDLHYLSSKKTVDGKMLLYFFNSIIWYIFHRFPFRRQLIVLVSCRQNVNWTFIEISFLQKSIFWRIADYLFPLETNA